jgi:A/G-specific adenine glycosylase
VDPEPLLRWYEPRRRLYPWRQPRPDPYRVLVSEVMLQQTQASRVVPAFRAFIRTFPSIRALAAASRHEVLWSWAGLGYNRRAVWLSESARRIVTDHGGRVPSEAEALVRLPGIGPYTAAAVASIAYGLPVPAIDTNARRVVSRAVLGLDGAEASLRAVGLAATDWMDGARPADWNQAVMDLGREFCRPLPRCERCPLATICAFRLSGRGPVQSVRRVGNSFQGSTRQLRGAVVRLLRDRPSASMSWLSRATSQPLASILDVVAALAADGVVSAGPAALRGRPSGRVRLPEG